MPESETIFDDMDNPQPGTDVVEAGDEQLGQGAGEQAPAEAEKGEQQGELEKPDFGGLPFKDIQALVKGYKELQSRSTKRDEEFKEMQGILKEVLPRLTPQTREEIKDDPEAFVKAFVTNPRQVLSALINEALGATLKTTIDPLRTEIGSVGANVELNAFLRDHPEFEDGDEDSFIKIMDQYPEIRTRSDRMEVWFNLFKLENPEIGKRMTQRKAELERGASDAKKAASLGGKKSSASPPQEREPFDDVIDIWKRRRSYYQR